jgi:CheY-like chemotaxis protein
VRLTDLLALRGTAAEFNVKAQDEDLALSTTQSRNVGLVLNVAGAAIALVVDQLIVEREMVLKPFTALTPVPAFLSGCTILPNGQAVPVLWPDALQDWLRDRLAGGAASLDTGHQAVATAATLRMLIVDDSLTARRWLVRSLERMGYDVLQCRDGQEAWEQLQKGGHYDLVVSDVEMPRMDGFQLLQRVRQHPTLARLPLALLTSRQGERHVQKAIDLGANGYFTKPLGNQQLLQHLGTLLEGGQVMTPLG